MVDRVCSNLEKRMVDDHHIQALSLKGACVYLESFLQDRHQRWLRE